MHRGFTMIEMVLVVVIVAMVALVATPRLSASRSGTRLQAAEARLKSEFAAVADLSRTTGRPHTIQFSTVANEFRVFAGRTADPDHLSRSVPFGSPPYSVGIGAVTIDDGRPIIVVDPYGMYSANAKVQVTSGSISRVFSLEGPISGAPVQSVEDAAKNDGLIGGLLGGLLGGL